MRIDHVARSNVRRWLVAAALVGLSLNAGAAIKYVPSIAQKQKSLTVSEIVKQADVVAGDGVTQALMTASPGTRYLPGMGGFTMAGNYGVAPGVAAGSVKVATDTAVNVAGKTVGVQVAGTISKTDIAAAVAGCFGATVVGCIVGGAATLVSSAYLSSSGIRVSPTVPGQLETVPTGAAYCYTAPCYEYGGIPTGTWSRDPQAMCNTFTAGQIAQKDGAGFYGCYTTGGVKSRTLERRSATVLSPTWYPITPQEVKDKLIADTANNPSPLIVPELQKAGVDWNAAWKDPTVVGPSEVKSPEQVTVKPDGTSSTKQSSTPLSYSGPTITAGPTVETSIDRNSSGTETGRTVTTTNPGTEATPPAGGGEEKENKLQCDDDKYPHSLGCIEVGDPPEVAVPKESKTITYSAETPFGGGSCPADRYFTSTMTGQTYKAVNWAQWCSYGSAWIRPLILLLATISAFFIVALGKDSE